jgi:hypothetical protein
LALKRFVATVLVVQLMLVDMRAEVPAQNPPAAPAPAQAPAAAAPQAPAPTIENLKVLVLEGQRSVNNTTRHVGIQPVVEVRDENDRPVEGAVVIFRLPPSGPGGTFPGKELTLRSGTNARGQAAASGFVPNDALGKFDIHVTASYQNQTGEVTISQTNSSSTLAMIPPAGQSIWRRHKFLIIGVGSGLVVGVIVALVLSHSSTKAVTITPGSATISQ